MRCTETAPTSDLLDLMDEIAKAAIKLAKIERKKKFIWEEQRHDWESVCARIAETICRDKRSPKKYQIKCAIQRGRIR